jgi:uncharacterized membrane protein YqiK
MEAMKLTALLTLATLTATAQVTLTPIQVRTVHTIMDSEARLREQAAIDSAQLADYATAIHLSEALRRKAEADAVDLRIIAKAEQNRADKLFESVTSQAMKTRARSVWAWVATGVALVEGVIIGVAVAVK